MLAQTGHVSRKFTRLHPEVPVEQDENLVVLAVPDERDLDELLLWFAWECPLVPRESFREPDLGDSLTAFAIVGTPTVRKRLAALPLALAEPSARAVPDAA